MRHSGLTIIFMPGAHHIRDIYGHCGFGCVWEKKDFKTILQAVSLMPSMVVILLIPVGSVWMLAFVLSVVEALGFVVSATATPFAKVNAASRIKRMGGWDALNIVIIVSLSGNNHTSFTMPRTWQSVNNQARIGKYHLSKDIIASIFFNSIDWL